METEEKIKRRLQGWEEMGNGCSSVFMERRINPAFLFFLLLLLFFYRVCENVKLVGARVVVEEELGFRTYTTFLQPMRKC